MTNCEILMLRCVEHLFQHKSAPLIEHVIKRIKFLNQLSLFSLRQLLQSNILQLNVVGLFQSFGVCQQGLSDDFGTLELLAQGSLVVLETILAQTLLDEDLLTGRA